MEMPFITAPAANQDILTSVWLYSTEKGRENKKRPYKYWMNNTEMFFEIYISHPVANPDVSILLEMTYKSFIQNARIFSYDNEKKNTAPISYIPSNVFSNPMVDDIRLVTLTNCGWRIPFRCHVSLPIDKVRYIKLYVQNSAIEFGIYSKASSKNKLDAGTPVLFPLMRENEVAMVSSNLPPMYMQIPTDNQLSLPAPNNFLTYQASSSPSTGALFPYDNYFNHPPGIRSDEFDSDEDISGEGSRKDGSLRSSTSSLGSFNNLAIDEKEEESSSEYSDEKKKKPKPRRQKVENRRRASLHKLRSSSENIPPVSVPFPQVKRSTSSGTTASKSQQKVRTPSSPRSPSVMSPRGDNLSVSSDSSHNTNEADKGYFDTRQFALVDPAQFQSAAEKPLEGSNFDWVLGGKRSPTSDHKLLWLYSTEKGRENKKRPYKYWMNNTEMFFEIYISHPVANPDVSILLEMTYKSFIQNARIFSYDNEKKNTAPISYIPSNVFSNPMVDDIRLVTLTNCGWRIPFRCHVSLPIDKVRYIKLYVQNSAIEFGIYSKASSKNKLDAGTPVLLPLMRENEVPMVSGNLPPMYMQIPTDFQLSLPAPNNFLAYQASSIPSNGDLVPYDNYFNHPPGVRSDEFASSDEDYLSGEGSDLMYRKEGSLRSSTSSLGSFNSLAIDEESSSEYSDEKKKPKRRQMVENRRRASLHKLRSSSEVIQPVGVPPTMQVKRSISSGTTSRSQHKSRTPTSPSSPSVMSPRGDNLSVSSDSSHNTNEADKGYFDTRQVALVDPTQFQPDTEA